jgi:hypothetical protein
LPVASSTTRPGANGKGQGALAEVALGQGLLDWLLARQQPIHCAVELFFIAVG